MLESRTQECTPHLKRPWRSTIKDFEYIAQAIGKDVDYE
jgi:hypothetical protein